MHIPVWIITPVTDAHELGKAFRKADQLAGMFSESNFKMDDRNEGVMPPLRNDGRETGGRWNEQVDPGPGNNWAFGKDTASRPDHLMPRAVITPEGYAALRYGLDETEEIRRALLHWPGNIVIAQDWHY